MFCFGENRSPLLFCEYKKTHPATRSGGTPIPAKTMQAEYVCFPDASPKPSVFAQSILAFSGANRLKRLRLSLVLYSVDFLPFLSVSDKIAPSSTKCKPHLRLHGSFFSISPGKSHLLHDHCTEPFSRRRKKPYKTPANMQSQEIVSAVNSCMKQNI